MKQKKNYKKKSWLHKKLGKIIEGQIIDCYKKHPQYFDTKTYPIEIIKTSIAKRITGEIIQYLSLISRVK